MPDKNGYGSLFGFNYVTSTAVNTTEMWDAATFDFSTIKRELKLAAAVGYNSCRVFLPFIVWEDDKKGFMERFDLFLSAAYENNISTMPVLFDDCAFSGREPYLGAQDKPAEGVHNSGWTPSPGNKIANDLSKRSSLRSYVRSLLSSYANDERIIIWDMYNEPGNGDNGEKSVALLQSAFEWARSAGVSQPLTVGVWSGADYESVFTGLSDVISFHEYGDAGSVTKKINGLRSYGKPLVCTEWLNRHTGGAFITHLPVWSVEGVGCYQWGLIAGRTQTYLSWNRDDNPPGQMPAVWQHDLLYPDGTAYDPGEIITIKKWLETRRERQ